MLDAGVAEGVELPDEHDREERAFEVTWVVAEERQRAENIRRAPPAVFPTLVRPVPLAVVARKPAVVLGHQLLPAFGLLEVAVRHPTLYVERRLDEALPGWRLSISSLRMPRAP